MTRLWMLPVAGVIVAPLVTWLPMLAHRYPGLGLPPYRPAPDGIDAWSIQVFWGMALLMIAALTWSRDRWLAAAVALVSLPVLLRGGAMNVTHSVIFTVGVALLLTVRQVPAASHPAIRWALVWAGSLQALYALAQKWLRVDPLWDPPLWGVQGRSEERRVGKEGRSRWSP